MNDAQSGPTEEFLTAKEVMAHLKISEPTFYRYLKEGIIPEGIKIGKKSRRWKLKDIEKTIDRRNETGTETPADETRRETKSDVTAHAEKREESNALGDMAILTEIQILEERLRRRSGISPDFCKDVSRLEELKSLKERRDRERSTTETRFKF